MLTKHEFDELLADRGSMVVDGALATELEARGHDLNHPLWSAKLVKEDPDSIRKVHTDYYLAGADIAITASYQASTQGFQHHLGIGNGEATQLMRRSVELAQQARDEAYQGDINPDRKLLIAGSVGSYGAYLADGSEYRGDYTNTKAEFQSFHRPRIQALCEAGVDILAIETMPKLEEIEAVLQSLREEFPGAICWLSYTLQDPRHMSDGTPIETLLKVVNQHRDQVVAVGMNCVPTSIVLEALQHMTLYTKIPLLCYPNSGESWDAETKTWTGVRSEGSDLEQEIHGWQTAGARLIGGCCRTGPEYIKLVANATAAQRSKEVT